MSFKCLQSLLLPPLFRSQATLPVLPVFWIVTLGLGGVTYAQVTPPITSSGLNTQISTPTTLPNGQINYNITGGTRPGNGPNLFHSFGEFGVPTTNIANFLNETALQTTNVLGRVTAGNPSNIFGTIQTTGFGNANLFLMNPAGIVFGPNASLNVSGAVNFTTADYLRLTDGVQFNAISNAAADALLSAAPVAAFGFLGPNAAAITVQGSNLSVPTGQAISLVGGNITVQAGTLENGMTQATKLFAPGGQMNLASVASQGEVLVSNLQPGPNMTLGTITFSQGATLDVSGNAAGTVRIRGGQFVIANATVSADTANLNGAPTAVDIQATGDLSISDTQGIPAITARTTGSGNAGEVRISSANLTATTTKPSISRALIDSHTSGTGQAGKVTITTGDLQTSGGAFFIDSGTQGAGLGGDVTISGKNVRLNDMNINSGDFVARALSIFEGVTGSAGNVKITADTLDLTLSVISADAFRGSGGDITLEAGDIQIKQGGTIGSLALEDSGAITVKANRFIMQNSTKIEAESSFAPGGDITITANVVELKNGSTIRTQTFGDADAGDILVTASDHITLADSEKPFTGTPSGFYNNSFGVEDEPLDTIGGNAGSIVVTTPRLEMSGGTRINTSTETSGRGGDVTITATDMISITGERRLLILEDFFALGVTNPGGIFTRTVGKDFCSGPCGDAGRVSITTGSLTLNGGARIDSGTASTGRGGDIAIHGTGPISMSGTLSDGSPSGVVSRTVGAAPGSGRGGSINLRARDVQLSNRASVSASSTGPGNAGAISILANNSFLSNNGTVSTTASKAQGGNITITAGQLVQLDNNASIAASSTGPGNAGNIFINAGQNYTSTNSSVTTQAVQASGGNITVLATDTVHLTNSQINASVQGSSTTIGGNIVIDPQFVILQNSQILAQAVQGQGGNITITTPVFLADASSLVDASSQFGLSGTVTIQSPTSNLSAVWARLQQNYSEAAALLRARCAAQVSGTYSSFVLAGRDAIPLEPGGWLLSPLALEGTVVTPPVAQEITAPPLALARVTLRGFEQDISWSALRKIASQFPSVLDTGCGS